MSGRPGAAMLAAALVGGAALVATPAAALTGTVVSGDKPLRGARVCYWVAGTEPFCTVTGPQGHFELPDSRVERLRVSADDYLARLLSKDDCAAPIELRRAATLFVELRDAKTDEPIPGGEVFVVYSTGQEIGPFPTNASGVRVRGVLEPGEVRVTARAEGYEDSGPRTLELVSGEQSHLELALTPKKATGS